MVASKVRKNRKRDPSAPRTDEWIDAGFNRATANPWREAGWEPADAAEWRSASPADEPEHLGRMRAEGYAADQLADAARHVRANVAAWIAATVGPAEGGPSAGAGRASEALRVLDAVDPGPSRDVVLDIREPVPDQHR